MLSPLSVQVRAVSVVFVPVGVCDRAIRVREVCVTAPAAMAVKTVPRRCLLCSWVHGLARRRANRNRRNDQGR